MKSKDTLANPAYWDGCQPPDPYGYDCCNDPLFFAMKDNYHSFSMGLFTILECLKLAEREGYVPKLPVDWWIKTQKRYGRDFILKK